MNDNSLTPKQFEFIEYYLETNNATEAAKKAGYSPKTARQQGSRLLSNVVIKKELDRRREEKILELRKEFIDYSSEAFSTIVNIMRDENNNPKERRLSAEKILSLGGFDKHIIDINHKGEIDNNLNLSEFSIEELKGLLYGKDEETED